MFHAGSFKHSVTSSHLLSYAKSPLFATAESSGLPSYHSREWPAFDGNNHSPRTLYTLDGTQTHVTHAMHAVLAAQRFVVVDFYGLRLDISTPWLGGSWDPVATMPLPAVGPSRHTDASNVAHISQQSCAVLEDFTVSLQTMASPDACTPCSIDVQCPSGMHAALSMVSADVLVDCMHALHDAAQLPHRMSPEHALDTAITRPADSSPGVHSTLVFTASPVATDNFDGAESDTEDGQSGSAMLENGRVSTTLPKWSQVALTFGGLQEVLLSSLTRSHLFVLL